MKINRKHLSYASLFFIAFFSYKALEAEQWVLTGVVIMVYMGYVFGIDKVVFDWKKKKVEIHDDSKS